MQFLSSALSSNELKALYILLSPAHLYTPSHSQLLNGAYIPDTRYKAPRVINVAFYRKMFCIQSFFFRCIPILVVDQWPPEVDR